MVDMSLAPAHIDSDQGIRTEEIVAVVVMDLVPPEQQRFSTTRTSTKCLSRKRDTNFSAGIVNCRKLAVLMSTAATELDCPALTECADHHHLRDAN